MSGPHSVRVKEPRSHIEDGKPLRHVGAVEVLDASGQTLKVFRSLPFVDADDARNWARASARLIEHNFGLETRS
jgi:hypothetical protein